MSPLNKSSFHLPACGLSRAAGSFVLAAIMLVSFAAFAVRKADNPVDSTSVSVFTIHASPAQTRRTKRRPAEVTQEPTITSSKQLGKSDKKQEPVCPSMEMNCPEAVVEGSEVDLTAKWNGGTPGVTPTYFWTASAGKIIKGQGSRSMTLSTKGVQEKSVTVTLELFGFGTKCSRRCTFRLDQREKIVEPVTPTPDTPTPDTPTPGPPASPSPTASPLVSPTPSPIISGVTPDASPPVSPQTSPSTTPPTNQGTTTNWTLILAAVLATLAIAVAALWLALRGSAPELVESGGGDVGLDDAFEGAESSEMDKAAVEEKLSALILGTKGKTDEDVCCTVFAPYEATPGDAFLVQAFAHLAEQAPLLTEIAKQADRDTAKRGSEKLGEITRGEKLGFYLEMPGLEIDAASQSLDWLGEIASLEFGVSVSETFKPRSINCKLSVSRHGVPVGHVKFNFKVSAVVPQAAVTDAGLNAHRDFTLYKLAFISYASADRSEVMKRVQMLDLAKIKYFQDLLSLEAGEQWEPAIYRYIDECDVFFLFWSTAAKNSKWVEKEVQRALNRKADEFDAPPEIMGVPIEGPPPVPPPPYLDSIHFDSKFLYFINPKDGDA